MEPRGKSEIQREEKKNTTTTKEKAEQKVNLGNHIG